MSQLATTLSRLKSQGKFPSQTEVNPKQKANAITLRSGKELPEVSREPRLRSEPEQEVTVNPTEGNHSKKKIDEQPQPMVIRPPFPERLTKSRKEKEEKENLEIFRKVEVNIPLLDTIKQIPRFAKFLKELCTNKKSLAMMRR